MDVSRLSQGEKIAGVAGILLIIIMFAFSWYGVSIAGHDVPGGTVNAWEAYSFTDIILFLAALSGIALAVTRAQGTTVSLPVALSAIVAGLGILATLLVLYRIINTPGDTGAASALVGGSVDVSRKIGVFLGLIAAAGVAYGGWTAMQEEGTSFSGQADRLRDGDGGPGAGPGAPPPTGGAGATGAPPPSA
jgi:hypothetical protein